MRRFDFLIAKGLRDRAIAKDDLLHSQHGGITLNGGIDISDSQYKMV